MAFFTAPVSNSAGQTRLPTFSRMASSTSPVPRPSRPWRVMPASRWHMPPVCSWMAFAPAAEMVRASTSESMSASITPIFISSFSASMVRVRVVVLPEPGLDIRFRRNTPFSFSSARSFAASSSLEANTLWRISRILKDSNSLTLHGRISGRARNKYRPQPNVKRITLPCGKGQ